MIEICVELKLTLIDSMAFLVLHFDRRPLSFTLVVCDVSTIPNEMAVNECIKHLSCTVFMCSTDPLGALDRAEDR